MKVFRVRSYTEYSLHLYRTTESIRLHNDFLHRHTPEGREPFTVPGYSYTAKKPVEFRVNYKHSSAKGGVLWRETVSCPETYFNNRMRATIHLFEMEMNPYSDVQLYLTEQVTPAYRYFSGNYKNTVGSEFLNDGTERGASNGAGVRNEDLTALTFPDASFEAIVSLDVFEHIPEFCAAFKECARVLRPGGRFMWSVPFSPAARNNNIRAKIVNNQIQHLHTPQYHGDPLSPEGILCFQDFGWEMLEQVRDAGFSDAYALCYHSTEYGYLGGEQFMFFAIKK